MSGCLSGILLRKTPCRRLRQSICCIKKIHLKESQKNRLVNGRKMSIRYKKWEFNEINGM